MSVKWVHRGLLPDKLIRNNWFKTFYSLIVFAAAVYVVYKGQEVIGAVYFASLVALIWVISDDFVDSMLPLLLLSVFVTRMYNSYARFIQYKWLAIPLGFALLFHVIWYWRRPKIGITFYGQLAVAVAISVSGIGTFPLAAYLKASSIYYILGLGFGMVGFYLLFSSHVQDHDRHQMARYMMLVGMMVVVCVVHFYYANRATYAATGSWPAFYGENNLATFMMMALPMPFWYASKRPWGFLYVMVCIPVFYGALVLCGSRGGMLLGTAEVFLLFIVYCIASHGRIINRIAYVLCFFVFGYILYEYGPAFVTKYMKFPLLRVGGQLGLEYYFLRIQDFVTEKGIEVRTKFIARAITDFQSSLIVGKGILYKGNSDLYNGVKGTMQWYHMWFPQIIGSMGLVGVAAYASQMWCRAKAYFTHRDALNLTLAMSAVGLWLMSQVNPGEFCPIPYALLTVIYFVLIENTAKEQGPTYRLDDSDADGKSAD